MYLRKAAMRNLKHSQLKHTNNLSLPQAQYHGMI
jgi:hypothetical protein